MTGFRNLMTGAAGAAGGGYQVDNSAVFNDDDSGYLTRTPSSAGNQQKWTLSFWFKFGSVTGRQMFYAQDEAYISINENSSTSALINIYLTGVSPVWYWETTAMFRDPHGWYHVVVAFDSTNGTADNRLRLYINGDEITSFTKHSTGNQDAAPDIGGTSDMIIGKHPTNSAQYYDGYFSEYVYVNGSQLAPTSFGERDDNNVWRPISIEDAGLTFGTNGFYLPFTNSAGLGQDYSGSSTESKVQENTYNAGSEVNNGDMSGSAAGFVYTAIATAKLATVKINSSSRGFTNVTVQVQTDNGSNAPDGTTLTNGEVTGITGSGTGLKTVDFPNGGPELTAGTKYWIVIPSTDLGSGFEWGIQHDVAGSGGALGIIDATGYQAGRGFGHEVYQVGNHFKAVNSPTQTTDSPTSNFATLSTIDTSPAVFSEGNLQVTSSTSNSYRGGTSSIGLPPGSGKWYVEAKTSGASTGGNAEYVFGAATNLSSKAAGYFPGSSGTSDEHGYYSGSGGYLYNNPNSAVSGVGAYGSGSVDTVALRFDMDASSPTCKFYVNNTLKHTANLTTGTTYFPHFNIQDSSLAWTVNFGATAFTYTIPADHKAISAANFFEAFPPAIEDGSAYMQSTLYTGNGLAGRDVIQSTQTQANLETGNNETNNGDMSGTAAGIKFVCTRTGKCPSIHIRTSTTGMSGVTCQIKQDGGTGQSPSGSVLTDGEKTGVSFSGQGYAIFDFPNGGPELIAGTVYWFMIPSDTGTWGIARDNDNSEGGPGGRISSSDGSYNTGSFGHKVFQVLGSQFQPDLIWGKQRTGTQEPTIFDAVRGTTKYIQTNSTAGEATQSGVTAFNSNGFELGSWAVMNQSSNNHVAWQWLAGNGTSSNTQGRKASDSSVITSTVSVNQTAGFSIVSWQGNGENSTIGHGLNAIPKMIIVKNRDSAGNNWAVYHVGQGNTHHSFLDSSNAMTAGDRWQDTTPTSTVFSVDGTTDVNKSGDDMIAYCWCEKPGFSKFNIFEGNGNSDGPFIELGFKPAWIMVKGVDANSRPWVIHDSARNPYNVTDLNLIANDNSAEASSNLWDFLSNGFKVRDALAGDNGNNETYIYMAFAEHPFAATTPATAR